MIDLTEIIAAVITLCISLITVFLLPLIKKRISAEKMETIQLWVAVAVEAAEQVYGSGNAQKRQMKKDYVEKFLKDKGFTIDTDSLDNLIESAVLNLNLTKKGVSAK